MSGRSIATIRVVKDGQEYVINQTDYRFPDNTVRPEWSRARVISQHDLSEEQIEINNQAQALDDADKAEREERLKAERDAEVAKLVDAVPTSGNELWAYITALPNKGAVIKMAQDAGIELDATLSRQDLNAAAFKELDELDEASAAEKLGEESDAADQAYADQNLAEEEA